MKNFPWVDQKISSINIDNLSHALIIEGQEGVGKNQVCQYLINQLLVEENSSNLIKNNVHPDLFCINKETLISFFERKDKEKLKRKTKKIPVEFIREAIDFVMLKPGLSKKKVLFIDNAEQLTISSQNTLLKTLEEPPQNTFIIIKSNRFKCLNQTIYSRCQQIHFNNISQNELESWAEGILMNKNDKFVIPSYMTPKKLSKLVEDGTFEDFKKLNKYLDNLFINGADGNDINDVIDLNIEFNEKLDYIIDFALSRSKSGESNVHPVRLSDFIEDLSNFRENLIEINSLNQRYALNHLLLKIPS